VIRVEREAIVLLELGFQGQHVTVGNLDLLTTVLANEVMVMIARPMVLIVLLAIAHADRRNEANALEPLQAPVDRCDIQVGLPRHYCRMNLFSRHMAALGFDDLEHLEALGSQAMALLAQGFSLFVVLHRKLHLRA
jgi:hypothetical protein